MAKKSRPANEGVSRALAEVAQSRDSRQEHRPSTSPSWGLVMWASQMAGHPHHRIPCLKNTLLPMHICAWCTQDSCVVLFTTSFWVLGSCVNKYRYFLFPAPHPHFLVFAWWTCIPRGIISKRRDLLFLSTVSWLLALFGDVAASSAGYGQGGFKKKCHGFIPSFKRLSKNGFFNGKIHTCTERQSNEPVTSLQQVLTMSNPVNKMAESLPS